MSGQISTPSPSPVKLNVQSPEGPKTLPVVLPFTSSVTSITLNLLTLLNSGQMSSVQSAFVDNSENTQQLSITSQLTGQTNVVPPESQAWVTILAPNQAQLTFASTGAVPVTVQLCNFANTPGVISSNSSTPAFSFASGTGYLNVTDVALDALTNAYGLKTIAFGQANNDTFRPAFLGTKAFSGSIAAGSTSATIITGSPSFFFTSAFIYVDPNAVVGTAADIVFSLKDGSNTIFQRSLYIPTALQPTYNNVIAELTDLDYISTAASQSLTLNLSAALSTGNVYYNVFGGTTASTQ